MSDITLTDERTVHNVPIALVLGRLQTLFEKLDNEGLYVSANTVLMAIDTIHELSADDDRCRQKNT